MNKLLFSLPKPTNIQVTDGTRNYTKTKWPIDTFVEHEIDNVNQTIDYYYQKMKAFVNMANSQMTQTMNQWYGVESIEEIFAQVSETYDKKFANIWSAIQATSTKDLEPNVQKLNEYTRQLIMTGEKTISFASILSILSTNQIGNISSDTIPGTINIDEFWRQLSGFANSYEYGSPQQIGANRALTFGQIYESGVNTMLATGMKNILNVFGTGHNRDLRMLDRELAGKTDGLLSITKVNYDLSQISPLLSGTITNQGMAKKIVLEEYDDIDLYDGGFDQAITKYINNPTAAGLIGVQSKAWTKPSGTMGSYAKSATEIANRATETPSGEPITKWFANDGRFGNYTGYVVSKYLINVIGAHNALMGTGAHGIIPTYMWLWNLYMSGKHIRHSFNLMQSVDKIRKDHTREMLAKNERSYHNAAIYQVRNNIIIANRKFA